MYTNYEAWGLYGQDRSLPHVLESYKGTDIVQWYGTIERQLNDKIRQAENNRNTVYTDKLRAFAKVWKNHELTGSVNREDVDALSSAAEMLKEDPWNQANYFSNLFTQLKRIIASVEELPMAAPEDMGGDVAANLPGGASSAGSTPPGFGPEDEVPGSEPDQGGQEAGGEEPPPQGDQGGAPPDVNQAVDDLVKQKSRG